jgi:CheY-like chemotaxis protein
VARLGLQYRYVDIPASRRMAGFSLLLALFAASAAWSESAPSSHLPTLTTAEEIRELSPDQAKRGYPVHLRAVVTYDDPAWLIAFFVQDGTAGVFVNDFNRKSPFKPGQLLDIDGVTEDPDFAPQITKIHYRVIGQSPLPQPRTPSFDALMSAREDSQWVEFEGIVRDVVRDGSHLLGLSISSRLVEMMNGRITLESELSRGSCFHFTIRVGVAASTDPVQPVGAAELCGVPVLVVDDNLTKRRVLENMLERWKMKPVLAASGREAAVALRNAERSGAPFGLLLIDAHMPDMNGFALAEEIRRQVNLSRTAIMMLTSAAQRGDAARCRELGVGAYLIKPIVESQLLDAIRNLLGTKAEPDGSLLPAARHSLPERARELDVLLAEDNAVNQKLATRLLESQGHTVTLAANGRDALALLEQRDFDLVLMDVSMPEIAGFQATAAIRARENSAGAHTPIIAMTAHAMTGDRERCLAAGMDGYVSKPIRAQELLDSIQSVLSVPA